MGAIPEAVINTYVYLLYEYVAEDILLHVGLARSLQAPEDTTDWGPHASECTITITDLIRGEMAQKVRDGFRIPLPADDSVQAFKETMNLLRISAVPQEHFQSSLILNLSVNTNIGTTSVNNTIDKEVSTVYMQFGCALTLSPLEIW